MAQGVSVLWIGGRRKALARAMAMYLASIQGQDWQRLHQATRDTRVDTMDRLIADWVAHGVLVQFSHPYSENAGEQNKRIDRHGDDR